MGVLIIDDDIDFSDSLTGRLVNTVPDVKWHHVHSVDLIDKELRRLQPEVVLLDLVLDPHQGVNSGFKFLKVIVDDFPDVRVIVLTGHGGNELGVRALNLGAASFLQKPPDIDHLAALIHDCLRQAKIRSEIKELQAVKFRAISRHLIGESACMKEVREKVLFAGLIDQPVLITGETGTGKGECALAIHRFGKRSTGRFVRYQPSTGSQDLIASDLFGHSRGSYTGATGSRRGLIEEASGGTLFLDEIDEFGVATQVALLGVLQEKRIRPVGENKEISVDFRLVCATNCDLDQAVSRGKLRDDFYHRIAHLVIHLTPLRERKEDIPLLALHILEEFNRRGDVPRVVLSDEANYSLKMHPWPGNIRELVATVDNAAYKTALDGREVISRADIAFVRSVHKRTGDVPQGEEGSHGVLSGSFREKVEQYKMLLIKQALARNQGNISRAATELGLERTSLKRLLRRIS
jgi:two-component system nitrogen regulation response regulator NtrX